MEDGEDLILHFGEHIGKLICDVPSDYLKWLVHHHDDDDVVEAAEAEYKFREQYKTHFWAEDTDRRNG